MRKLPVFSLLLALVLLLCACGGTAGTTPTPAYTPIPTPESITGQLVIQEDRLLYVNEQLNFQMELPADWEGKVEIGEPKRADGTMPIVYMVPVYQKAAREWSAEHGELFSIVCWEPDTEEEYITGGAGWRVVLFRTEEYIYVFQTPSGVEYDENDPDMAREWMELYDQFAYVQEHIKKLK